MEQWVGVSVLREGREIDVGSEHTGSGQVGEGQCEKRPKGSRPSSPDLPWQS